MAAVAPQAQYTNVHVPSPHSSMPGRTPQSSPVPSFRSVRIKSPAPSGRSRPPSVSSMSSMVPTPRIPASPGLSPHTISRASPCPSLRSSPRLRSPEEHYELLERKSAEVSRSLLEAMEDLDAKDSIIADLHHTIGDLTQKLVDVRRENVQIVKAATPFTDAARCAGADAENDGEKEALKRRVAQLEVENETLKRRMDKVSVVRATM
ncbi:hypothetical protein A1Q2_04556 [Trichosporon asahii var. asahii CBS 8904]|uniref:Uncharacterized protein n=1 Tax=Trichosporon asahii var. asahii (strain CBS 8904) TaxID=1220162 RepID=K1VW25_TRIAC|nr:hypothetical protein A1Q2_04556 [Trichosporon asahii var. asahii CBS 8904]